MWNCQHSKNHVKTSILLQYAYFSRHIGHTTQYGILLAMQKVESSSLFTRFPMWPSIQRDRGRASEALRHQIVTIPEFSGW